MPKIASICGVSLSVAMAALAVAPAVAAEPPAEVEAKPPAPSGPPKGYECHDTALTGSGPGFKSSQEESADAAIKDWLEKAKAIYRRRGLENDTGPAHGMREAGTLQQMLRHRHALPSQAEVTLGCFDRAA